MNKLFDNEMIKTTKMPHKSECKTNLINRASAGLSTVIDSISGTIQLRNIKNRKVLFVFIDKYQQCFNMSGDYNNTYHECEYERTQCNYEEDYPALFPIYVGRNKYFKIPISHPILPGDNLYCYPSFNDNNAPDFKRRFSRILNEGFNNVCKVILKEKDIFFYPDGTLATTSPAFLRCHHFVQYLMLGKESFSLEKSEDGYYWYHSNEDISVFDSSVSLQAGDAVVLLTANESHVHQMFYLGNAMFISKIGMDQIGIHDFNSARSIYNYANPSYRKLVILRKEKPYL